MSVIGKEATKPDEDTDAATALSGIRRWPVVISYFNEASGDAPPEYTLSFDLYENGVSGSLKLDYRSFALRARLRKLEILPTTACANRARFTLRVVRAFGGLKMSGRGSAPAALSTLRPAIMCLLTPWVHLRATCGNRSPTEVRGCLRSPEIELLCGPVKEASTDPSSCRQLENTDRWLSAETWRCDLASWANAD